MTLSTCLAFILLVLRTAGSPHREVDCTCFHGNTDHPVLSALYVCDAPVDRLIPYGFREENPGISAPPPYLEKKSVLQAHNVTSTTVHLSWSEVKGQLPGQTLELAGYFVTGLSARHCFDSTLPSSMLSYRKNLLQPWTNYTAYFRPFYTEDGEIQAAHKIGSIASLTFQTLSSEPAKPGRVSVLSAQQGSVVLNIAGPWTWNSDPVGFHVRWEAYNDLHWPRGELNVTLTSKTYAEETSANVTLPMRGGLVYRVSVSAVGAGESGRTWKSEEIEVEVRVPLDSYEVLAGAVDSFAAFVSWRPSEKLEVFVVKVYADNGTESVHLQSTQLIEAKKDATSRHSILIRDLKAWTYYIVNIGGCTEGVCSDAGNTTFMTPPETLPAPLITAVEATGSSSFKIAWQYPYRDLRFFDKFRVEYCLHNKSSCFVAYTKDSNLTVGSLTPATTIEISVAIQYMDIYEILALGLEATAFVTTWTKVPDIYITSQSHVPEGVGTCLVSWRCINSSVDYFQYRDQELRPWKLCNDPAECDVTFKHGRNVTLTIGYLILTYPRKNQVVRRARIELRRNSPELIWVRGCNAHGCGREHPLAISTFRQVPGPPKLLGVTYMANKDSAHLEWDPTVHEEYDGIEVVSWRCIGYGTAKRVNRYGIGYAGVALRMVLVEGLPDYAGFCHFNVSTYSERHLRRTYSLSVEARIY